ncbi:uncharacterized protein PpBr36_09631 [Pyricularia pennisetigena]|uniref:uncharacterized protein n=1 Tax=Pyricularia pennisetigena TaxID=1578925 RepID=UPI001154E12C|nr:uncharacterized protein PpBr36_09631 [Pyricularia pennisetigena]TLS22004.1 hypothetical protein PpBr36_09631 [Pyricularia pennisetigena]
MWLINAATLKRENRQPESTRYATLSHTWEDGEITFQDWGVSEATGLGSSASTPRVLLADQGMSPGMIKVLETCRLAGSKGIPYVWVDTCCIDKTSSSELSEAINSMFRWYEMAEVCFAYLSDLASTPHDQSEQEPVLDRMLGCRWFTRGWTLRELIAPKLVEFYDAEWRFVGTKADPELQARLSQMTGIDCDVLQDSTNLSAVAVGRRLCWASKRQTTREEDMAYCLFGLFGIHMPLIYGEGQKAFYRLQEAILATHDDLSLFCWSSSSRERTGSEDLEARTAAFAPSADYFWSCNNLALLRSPLISTPSLRMTDKAVEMETRLYYFPTAPPEHQDQHATLDRSISYFLSLQLGIFLGVKSSSGCPGDYDSGVQVLWRHTAENTAAGDLVRELFAQWDSWPVEYSMSRLQGLYSLDTVSSGDFIRVVTRSNAVQYTVRILPIQWARNNAFHIKTEVSDFVHGEAPDMMNVMYYDGPSI